MARLEWTFRKYSCAGCDKGFTTLKSLLVHRNSCTKYAAVQASQQAMTTEAYLAIERRAATEP